MIVLFISLCYHEKINHPPNYLNVNDYMTTNHQLTTIKNECYKNQIISSKISNENTQICFYNCTFTSFDTSSENSTNLYGKIIRFISATSKFDFCKFINNSINSTCNCLVYLNSTVAIFSECYFSNNSIIVSTNYDGFIIYSLISNLTINDCIFKDNYAYSDKIEDRNYIIYGNLLHIQKSYSSINNCSFLQNTIYLDDYNSLDIYGGLIAIFDSHCDLIDCFFTNNTFLINHLYGLKFRGAIYFSSSNGSIKSCASTGNFISINHGDNFEIWGGIICSLESNFTFSLSIFMNNTIKMNMPPNGFHNILGGSIYLYRSNNDFYDCSFKNNSIVSNGFEQTFIQIRGGSIYSRVSICSMYKCHFLGNNININTTGILCIYGGSVFLEISFFIFSFCSFTSNNCSFNSSMVSNFLFEGGLIHVSQTHFENYDCSYSNNRFFLKNSESTILYGIVIYLVYSNGTFNKCSFTNNIFQALNSDYNFIIYGFSLYFHLSNFTTYRTNFINNSISKEAIENIILYYGETHLYCSNCTFTLCIFNDVFDLFIGSNSIFGFYSFMFFSKGIFNNCIFYNNQFNEINEQSTTIDGIIIFRYSSEPLIVEFIPCFEIRNCLFDIHIKSNVKLNSVIHSIDTKNVTSINIFTNNLIRINNANNIVVFGGSYKGAIRKWFFSDNCLYPYQISYFKEEDIDLYDETSNKVAFNDVFNQVCSIPTFIFTESNVFSKSNSFGQSSQFTISNFFSFSNDFTKSNEFSETDIFSNTNQFSYTGDFTRSYQFTFSIQFSESFLFSNSFFFSKSIRFSESLMFSRSDLFSQTNHFRQTSFFSKSNPFNQTKQFQDTKVFNETNKFTETKEFSETNKFTKTKEFSQSNNFSFSISFSNSNSFSDTKISTLEIPTSIPAQTPKNQKVLFSSSFTLTYTIIKSVIFSFSYNHLKNTYSYFPYIIYSLSPSYIQTNYVLLINTNKKISPENLIGIVCGSVAVFFSILSITIIIIRKKNEYRIYLEERDFSFSSSSSMTTNETNAPTKQFDTDVTIETKLTNLDEFDDWL